MTKKLSVVIPCYNMGKYIQEAIDSVQRYPYQNEIEIIIINDGSDDNGFTENVINSYNLENLLVIHQSNHGLSHARNTGIKASNSPYVLILDADNKIKPDYISIGVSILDSNPEVAVVYGDNIKFGLKNIVVSVGDFDIVKLLFKNYIDACVVLRKSAWQSINGYDENMLNGYEDWDLNMRLFFNGWQFKYVNEVLFEYRLRENSMLVKSNMNREELLDYIFTKPEYKQINVLRSDIVAHKLCRQEFRSFQKKKAIKLALILENTIKYFLNK